MLSRTTNGALTYSPTNPLLALYFNMVDKADYIPIVEAAWQYNQRSTLVLLYDLRNCRGGKGRRLLFAKAICHLLDKTNKDILAHLPIFGSFKDYDLINSIYPINVPAIYVKYLTEDCLKLFGCTPNKYDDNTPNNTQISLAAKYAPNNKQPNAKEIRNQLKCSAKQYRSLLTALRKHLNIVETKMCSNRWCDIDYSTVSSLAFLKYKDAFRAHDSIRFNEFMASGRKINVCQLYPHEIVKKLFDNDADACPMFDQYLTKQVGLENCVVVCDTSGSMMNGDKVRPLDVAIALTLIAAFKNKGVYHNKFFQFSEKSKLVNIKGDNWIERVHNISREEWGSNTNIQSVFDQLLKYDDDVKTVLVISDMQFDECGQSSTNFDEIDRKYSLLERNRPNFVFWNVSNHCNDIPVKETTEGVVLVSGYSPSLFKLIIENKGDNITPLKFVENVINQPMYNIIEI